MKQKLLLFVLLMGGWGLAFAQLPAAPFSATLTGTACTTVPVSNRGTVTFQVTGGSWSGTIQPEAVIGTNAAFNIQVTPVSSTTPQSTITANGAYYTTVVGFDSFKLCGATISGGSATIQGNAAQYSTKNLGAGGGGGGGGGATINPTNGVMPVRANATTFNDSVFGSSGTAGTVLVGDSLAPADNTAENVANSTWIPIAPQVMPPASPSLAFSATGGSLANNATVFVKLTFAGQPVVVPSGEQKITLSACTGGNQCSVTVTLPSSCTSPVAPTTGCTVWSSTTTQTEKQQTASAACVNITSTTCVIGTIGAGSTLTTPATTGVNPPNLQAVSTPDGLIPSGFLQTADTNFQPLYGVDIGAQDGNIVTNPYGVLTWLRQLWMNDFTNHQVITNSAFSINHMSGITTQTGSTSQDNALGIRMDNANTPTPTYEEYNGEYIENYISNNAFNCIPAGGETCSASIRATTVDFRTSPAHGVGPIYGVVGAAQAQSTSSALYGGCNFCVVGVGGFAATGAAVGSQGAGFAGVLGEADNTGNSSGNTGTALYAAAPPHRFPINRGVFIEAGFSNPSDWAIESLATSPSILSGSLELPSILGQAGSIPVTGSLSSQAGSISAAQLPTPAISGITTGGTTGSSTYAYEIVAKDGNGGHTVASSLAQTNVGNAVLSSSNFNIIGIVNGPGPGSYDVYRITCSNGGLNICATNPTGKIGSITNTNSTTSPIGFNDTGLAGDGTTPPTTNTTGALAGYGVQTLTDCASSASPAVCGSASAGSVVIAAGATTVTVDTTAVGPNSEIVLTPDDTLGTKLGVTCNSTLLTLFGGLAVTNRSTNTSFQVTSGATPGVNPLCFNYVIYNPNK